MDLQTRGIQGDSPAFGQCNHVCIRGREQLLQLNVIRHKSEKRLKLWIHLTAGRSDPFKPPPRSMVWRFV